MSNFDAAFIKAYGRSSGEASVTVDTLRAAVRREEPIADQLPSHGKAPTLAELCSADGTGKAPQKTAARTAAPTAEPPPAKAPAASATPRSSGTPRIAPHTIVDDEELPPPRPGRTAPLSSFRRVEQRLARLHVEAESEDDLDASLAPVFTPESTDTADPWEQADSDDATASDGWAVPGAVERPQAAFQLEQFYWPSVVESLSEQAKAGFDALCEQLISGTRQGRKLLGITGTRAQAGVTTFLLTLAPQLATHGLRVAIVDADIEQPELAHQLGVLPQFTWQDVIQQCLPPGEGWVESCRDQVTLSALIKPIRKLDARLAAGFRELMDQTREAFDLTLVDLGQLQRSIELGVLSTVRPEGVVVVTDVRQRARSTTTELDQMLRSCGIDWWGVAENYSAAE